MVKLFILLLCLWALLISLSIDLIVSLADSQRISSLIDKSSKWVMQMKRMRDKSTLDLPQTLCKFSIWILERFQLIQQSTFQDDKPKCWPENLQWIWINRDIFVFLRFNFLYPSQYSSLLFTLSLHNSFFQPNRKTSFLVAHLPQENGYCLQN